MTTMDEMFERDCTVRLTRLTHWPDGSVSSEFHVGKVIARDETGLILKDSHGFMKFYPWTLVESVRIG